MDLKGILFKEKENRECYWSVVIETEWVQSGLWKVEGKKVEIVSLGSPLPWQKGQDLVEVLDSSLSVAIQNLSEDLEPQKTVFGLPSSWIEDDRIKPEYQEEIKKACSELSLKPIGFVPLTQAVAYYLKSQEGDLLNGIMVSFGQEEINVSLVIRGEIKGESCVSRSVSLVEDLVEGLSRFSFGEPFPPRIILYDGKEGELEEVRQVLTDSDWSRYQNIEFLHPPKIEIVKPEEKVIATSLAGGVELEGVEGVEVFTSGEGRDGGVKVKTEVEESNLEELHDDLGFVVGEDVREISEDVIGVPLGKKELPVSPNQIAYKEKRGIPPSFLARNLLNKIGNSFLKGREKIQIHSLFALDKKHLIYGILLLLFFLVGGFLLWWFVPKASVKIYVSPQKIEESVDLKFDRSVSSIDIASKVIPAREIRKEVSGEKTIPTTGTKVIGDKARGKVQIYHTGEQINLAKGTKLQNSSGLVFALDDDVTIASGSASNPSKVEVSVSALDIGAEYNLASGESFSIANYAVSTTEAKNEEAFSGGSSREISAVSAKDYDNLLSDLKSELKDKLLSDVEAGIADSEILIRESMEEEIKNRDYNRKVGDEASDLKLNITLSAAVLVANVSDFYEFAKEILKEKIPSGYTLRQDQLRVSFSFGEKKGEAMSFKTSFVANLLPKIDQEEIARSIAGRAPEKAEDFLVKVKGYDRAEINIKPHFGIQRLLVLPHVYKRIQIEVEASP